MRRCPVARPPASAISSGVPVPASPHTMCLCEISVLIFRTPSTRGNRRKTAPCSPPRPVRAVARSGARQHGAKPAGPPVAPAVRRADPSDDRSHVASVRAMFRNPIRGSRRRTTQRPLGLRHLGGGKGALRGRVQSTHVVRVTSVQTQDLKNPLPRTQRQRCMRRSVNVTHSSSRWPDETTTSRRSELR